MTIEKLEGRTILRADDGMGICPKSTKNPRVKSVSLAANDSPENWKDCDLDDVTEADKDAALRRFGVEV